MNLYFCLHSLLSVELFVLPLTSSLACREGFPYQSSRQWTHSQDFLSVPPFFASANVLILTLSH